MTNSGKLTIAGQELNIFLTEEDINKLVNAIKSTGTVPTVPPVVEVPTTPVVVAQGGLIGVNAKSIINNQRYFEIAAKNVKDIGYGASPDKWYSFVGGVFVPSHAIWIVVLRFNDGTKSTIELNGASGSFILTGDNTIIEVSTAPVVDTVTQPVVTQPNNNSFNFNSVQLNIAPLNQRIKLSNKVHFQTSAWSAGYKDNGSSAMRLQISRDNRTIYNLEVEDNKYPKEIDNAYNLGKHPDDWKNNHPTSTRLILPEGTYKIEYQNSSRDIDYPIVFTLIDSKDAGYFVYYPCGLKKQETLFFKQLNKGESLTTDFRLYDNVGVVKQQGNTLRKAVFINFIVDGKLSLERFEVDFGNNSYQTFDYLRAVSATEDTKLRYVMERDHSKFIELMIYPNSKEFMVLSKNGIDVAEEHIDLSESTFDYSNWNTNGVKFPNFKMTNNAGYEMLKDFGSIMQRNRNGELLENGAASEIVIPFIDGQYKSTQSWRYNCEI